MAGNEQYTKIGNIQIFLLKTLSNMQKLNSEIITNSEAKYLYMKVRT